MVRSIDLMMNIDRDIKNKKNKNENVIILIDHDNIMIYLENLPNELTEIIFSYLEISDISNLISDVHVKQVLSKKYFWINYAGFNGFNEYLLYFKLMPGVEYYQGYKDILDINTYITHFLFNNNLYFYLPVVSNTDFHKLIDPSNLYYFESCVKIELIERISLGPRKLGYFDVSPFIESREYPILQIFSYYSSILVELFINQGNTIKLMDNLTKSEFIVLLIKSRILGINIWSYPVSNLHDKINDFDDDEYRPGY